MNKKSFRKNKKKSIFTFIIICFFIIYIYFSSTKMIYEIAGDKYQSIISNCGYYALDKCISKEFNFDSICNISKDEKGNINFISTNTLLVNYLCKNLSLLCYEYLMKDVEKGIDIPVGVFCGIRIFAGIGKKINIKLITNVSVQCNLQRNFISVGINQTRQILSVVIDADIDIFNLFKTRHYEGNIEITLFDNLIIGKVPDVYLKNETIGSANNSSS